MRTRATLFAALLMLGACQPVDGDSSKSALNDRMQEAQELSLERDASAMKVEANSSKCADLDANWRRDGIMGGYYCFVRYSDAGKICSDSSECEGQCRVSNVDPSRGVCQRDAGPFGCHAEMIDGKPGPGLCVD